MQQTAIFPCRILQDTLIIVFFFNTSISTDFLRTGTQIPACYSLVAVSFSWTPFFSRLCHVQFSQARFEISVSKLADAEAEAEAIRRKHLMSVSRTPGRPCGSMNSNILLVIVQKSSSAQSTLDTRAWWIVALSSLNGSFGHSIRQREKPFAPRNEFESLPIVLTRLGLEKHRFCLSTRTFKVQTFR
jgi:hypothetical protein